MTHPLIRHTHRSAYRSGEWARVVGVTVLEVNDKSSDRICFQVEFLDGAQDLWPFESWKHFEFNPAVKP